MSTRQEADALVAATVAFLREWAIPGSERAMAKGIMDIMVKASLLTLKAVDVQLQAALGPAKVQAKRDAGKG